MNPIFVGYTNTSGEPDSETSGLREPVSLSYNDFEETHLHGIGATRSGKSKWLEHFCRELIHQRLGFTLIDPQGKLAESIIQYCAYYRPRQPVIYINPSRLDYLIPFVPWRTQYMRYTDRERVTATSVLVSKFKEVVLRVWGVDNPDDTPRLSRWLSAVGYLLVTGVISVNELSEVLTFREDGIRGYAVRQLHGNRTAQNEWLQLLSYKRITDFETQIESVRNRLFSFFDAPQIRRITSIDGHSLDFRELFTRGAIVIANLQATNFFSQEHARLIGTMIINQLWGAAREPHPVVAPYFLFIDEVENFITPDLKDILDKGAGMGLHLGVFHQHLEQLRARDSLTYASIMGNAQTKLTFGGLEYDSAHLLAKNMFTAQIDYDETKYIIEQTKFWPQYDREKVYARIRGGASGLVGGASSGAGQGWNPILEEWVPSEIESKMDSTTDMESWADSEADIPIYRPIPTKELTSRATYSLDEQLTRLTATLMSQYQRHFFFKRRYQSTVPAVTPFVEEYRIFPKREQLYILETCIKPYALSVDEIDRQLKEQLDDLLRKAQGFPSSKAPDVNIKKEDSAPASTTSNPRVRFLDDGWGKE